MAKRKKAVARVFDFFYRRDSWVLFGSVVLVILMQAFYVYSVNRLTEDNMLLQTYQDKIAEMKRQNTLLRNNILALESLANISSKAEKLGFVKASYTFIK